MYRELLEVLEKYVDKYDRNDKYIFGGYNVEFDIKFLRNLWESNGDVYFGSWFAYGSIDPSAVLRFFQYCEKGPNVVRAKLTDIAAEFGVLEEGAHDALVDVRMTQNVTRKMMELI
jgi:DNA polymerase-3 subunit epsilon